MQVEPIWSFGSSQDSGLHRWLIMAITFISLFIVSVVLASFFFVCRHHLVTSLSRGGRGFSRIPCNLAQRIPTEVFSGVLEVGSTSITCAICIDDYCVGDKLRILPCQHKFHAVCIDSWLGHWRSFCLVCKHDARAAKGDPPASEETPLLSPSLSISTSLQSLPISIRQEPLSFHCTAATHSSYVPHKRSQERLVQKIYKQNKLGLVVKYA